MIGVRDVQTALQLECQAIGVGRRLVLGDATAHVIEGDRCDCGRSAPAICAHRIRVLLDALAPELLSALRVLAASIQAGVT